MDKELLQTIAKNTASRATFQIILEGVDSVLHTTFNPPLENHPGCKYELSLASVETYYSFPNIDETNNKFKVLINEVWEEIIIPTGCYGIKHINLETQRQIVLKGGGKEGVTFTPNLNTFKCILTLGNGYQVDMSGENSIRTVLGFNDQIYKEKRNVSERNVDIMRVNSIFVHCDLISSSYVNGVKQPIMYSFFPDALPGTKIIERPPALIYLPIEQDVIHQMTSWLTDQDLRPLDLRGERLTLKFHVRAC